MSKAAKLPDTARVVLGALAAEGGRATSSALLGTYVDSFAEQDVPGAPRCDQKKAQAICVLGHGERALKRAGLVEHDRDDSTCLKVLVLTDNGRAMLEAEGYTVA